MTYGGFVPYQKYVPAPLPDPNTDLYRDWKAETTRAMRDAYRGRCDVHEALSMVRERDREIDRLRGILCDTEDSVREAIGTLEKLRA